MIAFARDVLDQAAPLADGLARATPPATRSRTAQLVVTLQDGARPASPIPAQFVGYQGDAGGAAAILLRHNGLHVEILIDRSHPIGKDDAGRHRRRGARSGAVHDPRPARTRSPRSMPRTRSLAYRNWLGLMKGTLTEQLRQGRQDARRARLNPDRTYTDAGRRRRSTLHGRSLMLVRNVGHLMTHRRGRSTATASRVPEGILDAVITIADRAARPQGANGRVRNSRAGSVYIVKPKMHGPEEVAFANELFGRVEDAARPAAQHASRSASWTRSAAPRVNLKACIRAAQRPRRLHQHRLPRPHRRRDPHLDGSRRR